MRAIWNGRVVAESDDIVVVEGHHYFPADSVDPSVLRESDTHTHCFWKGEASYYSLVVDCQENVDAVWFYPRPTRVARKVAGRLAFWHGVSVEKSE